MRAPQVPYGPRRLPRVPRRRRQLLPGCTQPWSRRPCNSLIVHFFRGRTVILFVPPGCPASLGRVHFPGSAPCPAVARRAPMGLLPPFATMKAGQSQNPDCPRGGLGPSLPTTPADVMMSVRSGLQVNLSVLDTLLPTGITQRSCRMSIGLRCVDLPSLLTVRTDNMVGSIIVLDKARGFYRLLAIRR